MVWFCFQNYIRYICPLTPPYMVRWMKFNGPWVAGWYKAEIALAGLLRFKLGRE